MVTRHPPVPPENRSPKKKGGDNRAENKETQPERENLKEQGRQGNIYQNTRNQGYQQDR